MYLLRFECLFLLAILAAGPLFAKVPLGKEIKYANAGSVYLTPLTTHTIAARLLNLPTAPDAKPGVMVHIRPSGENSTQVLRVTVTYRLAESALVRRTTQTVERWPDVYTTLLFAVGTEEIESVLVEELRVIVGQLIE